MKKVTGEQDANDGQKRSLEAAEYVLGLADPAQDGLSRDRARTVSSSSNVELGRVMYPCSNCAWFNGGQEDKFAKLGRIMCPAYHTKVLRRPIEPNGQK